MDVKKSDIWPKENLPYGHQKICHGVRKFAMDVRKSFMGFIDYTWTSKNLPWTLKIIHGRQKFVFEDDLKTIWDDLKIWDIFRLSMIWVWFEYDLSMIWAWFDHDLKIILGWFEIYLLWFWNYLTRIWVWFENNFNIIWGWKSKNEPYGRPKICHGRQKICHDVIKSAMDFKNLPWTS